MGTDIHFYVEKKVDGKWVSADKWTPDNDSDEGEDPNDERPLYVHYGDQFYNGRNYDLFAMLADVRNGTGFAGIKTGEGFVPISEPRGFPDDASPELTDLYNRYGHYDHDHSWLTLAELKAYDWYGQKTKHQGVVEAVNFAIWEKEGKPRGWCGSVDGHDVRHISHDEMRALCEKHQEVIAPLLEKDDPIFLGDSLHAVEGLSYYTKVKWEETYAESVRHFLDNTMPKLEALAEGRPEDVRIVFWFDS